MKNAVRPRRLLVVLDFDGFLLNSYALLALTLRQFGLDVGDEERFRNRRKFLKYLGGGKELLNNLVRIALPSERRIREALTECYHEHGRVYPAFRPLINHLIAAPGVQCGVLSRNYTCRPGPTIRAVLRQSGIDDDGLDFVIPIPVGIKKNDVLAGLRSSGHHGAVLGGDEIGDYRAAVDSGYDPCMASYGFDGRERLLRQGAIPDAAIHDTPAAAVEALVGQYGHYFDAQANADLRVAPPALLPEPVDT